MQETLAIGFVWNQVDTKTVGPYVEYVAERLTRSSELIYSHNIDIPMFFYTNREEKGVPPEVSLDAKTVVVYVFVSRECVSSPDWGNYMEVLYKKGDTMVIPIALDNQAYNISDSYKNCNFIRKYEIKSHRKQQIFLAMAHELYKNVCANIVVDDSKCIDDRSRRLKLFLSHAKGGGTGRGLTLALQLKEFIDKSHLLRFFDAFDIAAGGNFNNEIVANIKTSTVIVINSDAYGDRYWCQREIQEAKKAQRPIVVVDFIEKGADRFLPQMGNVPVIRVEMNDGKVTEENLYRILGAAVIESIRFEYVLRKLNEYVSNSNIKAKIICLCRPPEVLDVDFLLKKDGNISLEYDKLLYPDPSLYPEEVDCLERLGIQTMTPMEKPDERLSLREMKVGISISTPDLMELAEYGMNEKHLETLSQAVASCMLGRGVTLVYGGDLRDGGYTQQLLSEALVLHTRLGSKDVHVKNYLAWPHYLKEPERLKNWEASYKEVLSIERVEMTNEEAGMVEAGGEFVLPNTLNRRYVYAETLSRMRKQMVGECNALICVGGKTFGYTGKMPGILEEIYVAVQKKCPFYLLGGFGGITKCVCEMFQDESSTPDPLTEKWQREHNFGYCELLGKYQEKKCLLNYRDIIQTIRKHKVNNGLTKEENIRLSKTVYKDEALQLVLKGLRKVIS